MESLVPYIVALVPTIGVATIFYFVMKNIIEGDRKERLAQARWEAERKAEAAKTPREKSDG
jgi:hypothetical protein